MSSRKRFARRRRELSHSEKFEQCRQSIVDTDAYDALCKTGLEFLVDRDAQLQETFLIGSWSRYTWDMDAGTLTFHDAYQPRVIATVQFTGTYACVPRTWLWSWANPSIASAVTGRMHEVREYGRQHGIAPLVADHWHAPESHGLEMTAVTAYLLNARGAYRAPGSMRGTTIYMVLLDVQWVG